MFQLQRRFAYFFTLLVLIFSLVSMTGCSKTGAMAPLLDPLSASDSRRSDPQKSKSLILANYYLQHKYDLLQSELQTRYEQYKSEKLLIGQLFSAIDLAEFYTYGFINYEKSLDFYKEAERLNRYIQKNGYSGDIDDGNVITYYKASGRYAVPREYNDNLVAEQILAGKKRIARIFGYQKSSKLSDNEFPKITALQTDNYAYAILVERDILKNSDFDAFSKELSRKTRDYFEKRYKLSTIAREYYAGFNILRGLINVFDIASLSRNQIDAVYNILKRTRAIKPAAASPLENVCLDFSEILCLTRLGNYQDAVSLFDRLKNEMEKINKEVHAYTKLLKESKSKAETEATLTTMGSVALAVVSMGFIQTAGVNFYINMIPAGMMEFEGHVSYLQRQLKFTGESEYSKNWNILFNIDDQLQLFRAVGKCYHKLNHLEKSILFNTEAVNIIANLRSTITTEKGRIWFAGYRDAIYTRLIEDLFKSKKYGTAFFYAENSKARSLVDLIGSRNDISFGGRNENNYVNQIKHLQISRDALKRTIGITDQQVKYLHRMEQQIDTQFMHDDERGLSMVIGNKEKKKCQDSHDASKEVTLTSPYKELKTLITVENLDYHEIQKLLPSNTTLVEFFTGNKDIYAWIIDKDHFKAVQLELNQNDLRENIKDLVKNIKTRKNSNSLLTGLLKNIYNNLFMPIQSYINNSRVYLVPHGYLHALPFDALFKGDTYLLETFDFCYLPSASIIQFLEPMGNRHKSALIFGNPQLSGYLILPDLIGAEHEAKHISALFNEKELFIGKNASETNFRSEIKKYTITHFAGHSLFDNQNAMNAKLLLAPDDLNDGQLTAHEIYDVQGVSNLVVLSACETAKAAFESGDERLGLLRGFFYSGASSVIAGPWNVDDLATSKLMEHFYTYMVTKNMSPSQALRAAKIKLLHSGNYQSPFYWAAFNLYGLGI